jgi:putative transposase
MAAAREAVLDTFRLPDALWKRLEPLLPKRRRSAKGGRPPLLYRQVLDGIFYVLRTGCHWKAAPPEFGSGSSLHRYFQRWQQRGVFRQLWQEALHEYDAKIGIDWQWQSMDGSMTKAPLGGKKTGKNPTDRAKIGTQRSLLTDGRGVPLGLEVAGANKPDMKLVEATLQSIPIQRPQPTRRRQQHFCADKGFDFPSVRELVQRWGYTVHIAVKKKKGAPPPPPQEPVPGYRARRWVVERTHSWMNRFRRLLIRWEKKVPNYKAFLHFACAWITFRAAGVLG